MAIGTKWLATHQRRSTHLPPSSELHSPISTATTFAPYFETQIHQIPSIHFPTHCFHFDEVVAIAEGILYTLVNAVVATTDSAVTANGTSNNAALRYRIEERRLYERNNILFNGEAHLPETLLEKAFSSFAKAVQGAKAYPPRSNQSPNQWSTSPPGSFKVNVDVAFVDGEREGVCV
ncbi:hypothetical protein PIB30_032930 [Stylosanthes scabra]|uniref:Uncharacterized protein n=1 Tax=Stylosanthes scabra TaxID=79078 RepID=A0ABU6WC09_9FABA|nr:hypothetical protein [Stylosanthes scabra]